MERQKRPTFGAILLSCNRYELQPKFVCITDRKPMCVYRRPLTLNDLEPRYRILQMGQISDLRHSTASLPISLKFKLYRYASLTNPVNFVSIGTKAVTQLNKIFFLLFFDILKLFL